MGTLIVFFIVLGVIALIAGNWTKFFQEERERRHQKSVESELREIKEALKAKGQDPDDLRRTLSNDTDAVERALRDRRKPPPA